MSLAERAKGIQGENHSSNPCAYIKLFSTLTPEDQESLTAMMADVQRFSGRDIWLALKQEGFKVASETINYHRYGRCTCVTI